MNVQEVQLRNFAGESTRVLFPSDRSSFQQRAAAVAEAAATEADAVDREARFPRKGIDAARKQRLLGAQIPIEFGGDGASISEVADMCYALGRACASAGMIFAMHQTKVACLVRHGAGSGWHESLHAPRGDRTDAAGVVDHGRPERRKHTLQFGRGRARGRRRDFAGARRDGDFLRRRGGRHRHHRSPRRRSRRIRPGDAGHHPGRLHAGAYPRMGDARHARDLQRRLHAELQGLRRNRYSPRPTKGFMRRR